MTSDDLYSHYRHRPPDPVEEWHAAGMHAPGDCVRRDGVNIVDTVLPDEWPTFKRRAFYELGWRPWSLPGVEPVWWSVTDEREPTSPTDVLAREKGWSAGQLAALAKESISVGFKAPRRRNGLCAHRHLSDRGR